MAPAMGLGPVLVLSFDPESVMEPDPETELGPVPAVPHIQPSAAKQSP
jgi:hypothetical protein